MPNGGSDCCGECVFNPDSRARSREAVPGALGRCEIRSIVTDLPFWTYCANFHTRSRLPDGPVFAGFHEWGRLPWHGDRPPAPNGADADRPCVECGGRPTPLILEAPPGRLHFCGGEHYLAWWRQAHPGESGEYPWALHEAMFDPRRRASGHDAPHGLRERLWSWLRR